MLACCSIQPEKMTKVPADQEWSTRIGLSDMSMSYFERLFRLYHARGWQHLIGILSEQGRMHNDIMHFANQHVYRGVLKAVNPELQGISLCKMIPNEP